MRYTFLILPFALLGVAGCVEAQQGPRVVTLSNDRFDIRSAPPIDGQSNVDTLAARVCQQWGGRQAQLQESAQYLPLDLNTSTYKCVPPASTSNAVPSDSSLKPQAG